MKNKLDSEHTLKSRIDNAVSFVPNNDSELAIVPLSMLLHLTKGLNKATSKDIIRNFRDSIQNLLYDMEDDALETAMHVAQEFVDFHKTVNLIEKYSIESVGSGKNNADLAH